LPLPAGVPTFGYTTAVDVGKDLVRNLMKDAATTDKWFFVTIMGRHAGHLALGIGSAAGATLAVIGEEFPEGALALDQIADILEGAIIKRRARAGGFDIHYCRSLGYWATRFLIEGGTEAMATIQGEAFVPVPFRDLIDSRTGRFRVRHVDVNSEAYQMLAAYMIRLTRADLED